MYDELSTLTILLIHLLFSDCTNSRYLDLLECDGDAYVIQKVWRNVKT